MVTPEQIRKKAERWYRAYLLSLLSDEPFFPRIVPSDTNASGKNIPDLHRDMEPLLRESGNMKGWGYSVELVTVETRKNGRQTLPGKVWFETEDDYLRFLKRENEVRRFRENVALIRSEIPALEQWLHTNPFEVIAYERVWPQLLGVCHYFMQTPRPGLYIRELPLRLHTKFVEEHKGVLRSLLDEIIPDELNPHSTVFEERFHLKRDEPLIRLKVLDESIARQFFSGISDLAITQRDFAQLALPVQTVFIMENKTNFSNVYNFLALPGLERGLALFGKGFAAGTFIRAPWLAHVKAYYWGDIDTHGMLILNQIRKYIPHVIPVLMDRETLMRYQGDWSAGERTTQINPEYLLPEERELFHFLLEGNIRLEQEKIRQEDVVAYFAQYATR